MEELKGQFKLIFNDHVAALTKVQVPTTASQGISLEDNSRFGVLLSW